MIAVLREERVAGWLDPSLLEGCAVFADLAAFDAAIPSADCLIVAFDRPGHLCSEAELRTLGRLGFPPLILVVSPSGPNLDLVARCTCFGCAALGDVDSMLEDLIRSALDESPRIRAATTIIESIEANPVAEAIVREVLTGKAPVKDEQELCNRLEERPRALRSHWKRAAATSSEMTLQRLLMWGRLLWELRHRRHGANVTEIAVELEVDESTIYRDFALLHSRSYGESRNYRPQEVVAALLREFASAGQGPDVGGG